jgi:hypothetical protein
MAEMIEKYLLGGKLSLHLTFMGTSYLLTNLLKVLYFVQQVRSIGDLRLECNVAIALQAGATLLADGRADYERNRVN